MSNSSICPIDKTKSSVNTLSQSGPGSNGNKEGTTNSPNLQDWSLTIICFISRTLVVEESYLSEEMQSVYSTAQANWASYFKDI